MTWTRDESGAWHIVSAYRVSHGPKWNYRVKSNCGRVSTAVLLWDQPYPTNYTSCHNCEKGADHDLHRELVR